MRAGGGSVLSTGWWLGCVLAGCTGGALEPQAEGNAEPASGAETTTVEAEPPPGGDAAAAAEGPASSEAGAGTRPSEQVAAKSPPAESSAAAGTPGCVRDTAAKPKLVDGADKVTEAPAQRTDTLFKVGPLTLNIPGCTPDAWSEVITVRLEFNERPKSSHVAKGFKRHGQTLVVDMPIEAAKNAPLQVSLRTAQPQVEEGSRFVLAVEHPGECEGFYKRAPMGDGDCSHWKLYDTTYDEGRRAHVADVSATGGHRLQFGWMPK